jgi:replicative DNA helicase
LKGFAMAERKETSRPEKIPPQSIEVEQAVLGAMLLDKEAIGKAVEIIDKDSFYRDDHQKIFSAIVDLYDKNQPVDIITVSDELARRKELDNIGGRVYLLELTEKIATTANIEYHANIILEKATLRKLIGTSTQIVSQCYDATLEVDDLLDRAEQEIFNISEKRIKEGFVSIGDLLPHTFEAIEEYQKKGGMVTGLSTGFVELDTLTGGLQRSDLIVVASRPSMGKTAFCLSTAEHVAIEERVPVGIFSLEMAKSQLAQRMLCSRARFSTYKMRTGRISDHEYSNLAVAVGPLAESKIFIDDTPNIGILQMRAKARRLKAQHNVGLVIVDYLQLMQGPKRAESRQQEISMISRSLKGLAKELEVPVIAVSQLSRKVEDRGGDKIWRH